MKSTSRRNYFCFGLGTIGRDMFYTMVSMYLLTFLTEILDLPDSTMWWMTGVMTILRVFDAVNDPIMGVLVDNTKSRFGKFKPWLVIGGILGAVFMVLMFADFGLTGAGYVIAFTVFYLAWDFTYGANDIAYWSMLPALTIDQKEREKMGAFARICANVGMFIVVVGIIPITKAMGVSMGSDKSAWFTLALVIAFLMLAFQAITVFGVRESEVTFKQEEKTTLRDLGKVLFGNDQLRYTAIAMALFMGGYCTTTSFGVYYFKYAFKNENMYAIFAAVLGVSQLSALTIFPVFSKKFDRKTLYTGATVLVFLGYILFFFAPMNMIVIGIAGVLIFVGQAFIQLLMLMFLADTIEYGQWKSGKRNESVTFSVQPFINKIGGAIGTGIVSATLIISGINSAATPNDVTETGLLIMKAAMLILPMLSIIAGYIVYRMKYKIDQQFYEKIVKDLEERGDLVTSEAKQENI